MWNAIFGEIAGGKIAGVDYAAWVDRLAPRL
jgi:hypothetical protein